MFGTFNLWYLKLLILKFVGIFIFTILISQQIFFISPRLVFSWYFAWLTFLLSSFPKVSSWSNKLCTLVKLCALCKSQYQLDWVGVSDVCSVLCLYLVHWTLCNTIHRRSSNHHILLLKRVMESTCFLLCFASGVFPLSLWRDQGSVNFLLCLTSHDFVSQYF